MRAGRRQRAAVGGQTSLPWQLSRSMIAPGGLAGAEFARNAEYGVPGGQVCGSSARTEWPVLGSRGTVLLAAAGAFGVALTARRSWFCYHQLFAVLLVLGRRRTGLAKWPRCTGRSLWPRACGS